MKQVRDSREDYWEAFVDALSTAVLVLDMGGDILYANHAACSLFKKKETALIGTNFGFPIQTTHPEELEIYAPDNQVIYVESSVNLGKWKEESAHIVTLHDITLRKAHESQLKISANVFHYAKEGIIITDAKSCVIDVNKEFCNITGYAKHEVIGKHVNMLSSGKHNKAFYQRMWEHIEQEGYWYGKVWNKRKSGELYPELLAISRVKDEVGEVTHYIGVFYDIHQQELQKAQLERMAHFDSLTDLPNRVLLVDRLQQMMYRANRFRQFLALVFIDLDDFKSVNDSYGHEVGDLYLKAFAKVIGESIRKTDTLSRYGGDEFILLIPDINGVEYCTEAVERIYKTLEKPIIVQHYGIKLTVSMGVTLYPQSTLNLTPEQLIRQADQAMYKSKLEGKEHMTVFDVSSALAIQKDSAAVKALQAALAGGQVKLYYQPKINMQTRAVIGVEGLLRWEHPSKGLLFPRDFLYPIRYSKFMVELTEWTISTALEQIKSWRNQGLTLPISINVDAMQLEQENFIEVLEQLLKPYPKELHKLLEFEVLESSIISNFNAVSKVVR